MTTPTPTPTPATARRWVKPAVAVAAAAALIGGGIAAWTVSRPPAPEPPGFVYNSSDHDFTAEELEPWKQRGGSLKEVMDAGLAMDAELLTPMTDAVSPAACEENPERGSCRLSEILRGAGG